ncbi:MAG TPA: glycosyltransferase family 39 protein [Chloroflexia bacterium]|nr:glycosyltransferase family 39 protein [Chloroflexia bacterium]
MSQASARPRGVAVVALLLAVGGQLLLDRRASVGAAPGGLVLGLGALLAAWALARSPALPLRPATWRTTAAAPLSRTGAALLIGALLLGLAAVPGFVRLAQTGGQAAPGAGWPWLLWLLAVLLFAAAGLAGTSRQSSVVSRQSSDERVGSRQQAVGRDEGLGVRGWGADERVGRDEGAGNDARIADPAGPNPKSTIQNPKSVGALVGLALIVAAAALLRFYALDSVPRGFWADEAIAGLQAQDILARGWRPLFIGGANGEPALYLYGLALMIKLLGPTVLAVRLPMALAGTLAVPALAALAWPIYGRRVALVAAALLAAMTWQINFSRIGFNAAWSLPVDLLAGACLIRALATGRVRWYLWAGVLCGLGFQLYYISRAWLVLLGLLLAYRLATERGLWRRARGGLLGLGLGLVLGAAPILVYAAVQPADYLARASSVSLGPALAQAGSLAPLLTSLGAHLAMWNVAGDPNGRHNLPGARLLDPLTAALLPCGLALALALAWGRRRGRVPAWPYLFAAAGLLVLLAGGVLSSPDESPQALRTLGDSSLVALLAALPLAALWPAGNTDAPPRRGAGQGERLYAPALIVGVLILVFAANARRYFLIQEPHPAVYKEFSTPARLVAERIAAHGPGTDDFIAAGLYEQATLHYLAGGPVGTLFSSLAQTPLPPGAPGRAAMLFLDSRNNGALPWLQTLYPHATVEAVTGPQGGNALFFTISIPAADRAAPYHLSLTLQGANGIRVSREETAGVDVDWSRAIPAGLTLPVEATWRGALRPPASGVYHVRVEQSTGLAHAVRLEVAGRPLDPAGADLALIAGRYPFTLTVTVRASSGVTRLRWAPLAGPPSAARPPDAVVTPTLLLAPEWGPQGVTATYRDGTDPAGPVGLVREEPSPSWFFFYTPFGVGPFVGEWEGTLLAPQSGHYGFDVDIGGQPRLWLDGREMTWTPAGRSVLGVPLFAAGADLAAGAHRFRFRDSAPWWREPCLLFWTLPDGGRALIPADAFLPDLWPK